MSWFALYDSIMYMPGQPQMGCFFHTERCDRSMRFYLSDLSHGIDPVHRPIETIHKPTRSLDSSLCACFCFSLSQFSLQFFFLLGSHLGASLLIYFCQYGKQLEQIDVVVVVAFVFVCVTKHKKKGKLSNQNLPIWARTSCFSVCGHCWQHLSDGKRKHGIFYTAIASNVLVSTR